MRTAQVLVLDDDHSLADQVERAVASLRPRPAVLRCAAFDELDQHGPTDLLIAGPSMEHPEGLNQLRQLRARAPQTGLVLAFEQLRGGLRATVRTGALDIVRLPAKDQAIAAAVEQALEMAPTSSDRRVPAPSTDARGRTIVVVSAAGGCGKTFFSVNLAHHLQTQSQRRTCLVDLDLQFGELCAALRLDPQYTLSDLVGASREEGDLSQRFESFVAVHETGVSVLAGPDRPEDADDIDASEIAGVLSAARSRYDDVVIDTSGSLSEVVLAALDHADQIFAVATLDLPSIRNLGVLLSTLSALKVPSERIQLVLNKVEPDVGIAVDQVEKYFSQGFSMVIPYGREVNRALNAGQPVLAYAPRADVSKALTGGLAKAMSSDRAEPEAQPSKRRFRRRAAA